MFSRYFKQFRIKQVPIYSRIGPEKVPILPESPFPPYFNIIQYQVLIAQFWKARTVYYSAIKWSDMKISTRTLFYMHLLGSRIYPNFWFLVISDFRSFFIFGYFLFWVIFDFGSVLILGLFWFWVFFDFGSSLILGLFWFWVFLILGHFWSWVIFSPF